ncbi:peptidoglycan DD-metalloendopeptidase family protein [Pseudalkalibacillus sp. R45]|uniref:peptidoglycan DD-metalloendopeptidase family protein n=1 Tax=Pseudalkalibacillus sp. R45 TaxID=3457433 RepID=UPI003FCDC6A1
MKSRADEIRRKYHNHIKRNNPGSNHSYPDYKDKRNEGGHPLFSSQGFLFRLMAAVCLFLIVGIVFKNPSENLNPVRNLVNNSFEQEFQFASIAGWYEEKFGKPLALFPTESKGSEVADTGKKMEDYALPANTKVLQSFKDNGQGILLETGNETDVSAIKEGFVIFVGEKDKLGKTVVVQHFDGSESWYGKLDKIDDGIKLYNYIDLGTTLGKVTMEEGSEAGMFYFAIKDNGGFVDPMKVLSSE